MINVGDTLPEAKFMTMTQDGPKPMSTDDVFKGKKVAVFAVPGAFTPTCSAKHLPGFVGQAADIKAKGVDTIACLSVNDVFVMGAWGKSSNVDDKVLMLADGNGDFTRALGLQLDGRGFSMGERSQRYAMVVEDGKVTKLFVEKPGAFEVSSAENVLKNL
jgi:peroxiredoxin